MNTLECYAIIGDDNKVSGFVEYNLETIPKLEKNYIHLSEYPQELICTGTEISYNDKNHTLITDRFIYYIDTAKLIDNPDYIPIKDDIESVTSPIDDLYDKIDSLSSKFDELLTLMTKE